MSARRVCLVTSGQPATNPRLVKEADALAAAGYRVQVIGAHWSDWGTGADADLVAARRWSYAFIDWRRESAPVRFWWSRARHRLARDWAARAPGALTAAAGRVSPELARAARRTPADLYIAHNLAALPAAASAAARHGGRLGFDAEDFHRGEFEAGAGGAGRRVTERVEARYLPRCDYVTAAAPGIADAYAPIWRRGRPRVVLNTFPLAGRPPALRPGDPGAPLRLYWFSQTIGPGRGLEDAVRAMGLAGSGVELHLRGSWWPGYRAAIDALAGRCGVAADRIVSHPPAPPDDMVRLAAAFDVGLALEPGVTPNSAVLLSNKLFTWPLAGLAVAGTRTPGQAPVIEALGEAARGYPPGDAAALAALLGRWRDDRGALESARRSSWDAGTRRFNWDREQAVFLDVATGTLDRRNRAPGAAADPSPGIRETL